jgi:hypothetical protein
VISALGAGAALLIAVLFGLSSLIAQKRDGRALTPQPARRHSFRVLLLSACWRSSPMF